MLLSKKQDKLPFYHINTKNDSAVDTEMMGHIQEVVSRINYYRVLLLDKEKSRLTDMRSGLFNTGFSLCFTDDIDKHKKEIDNDVQPHSILMGGNINSKLKSELAGMLNLHNSVPYLLFMGEGNDQASNNSGMHSVLLKPLSISQNVFVEQAIGGRVKEIEKLGFDLKMFNRAVNVAVGFIMQHQKVNYDFALEMLRSKATSQNLEVVEVPTTLCT